YDELVAALDELLGEIKGDGDHPLGGLAACMGTVISAYDQVHYPLLTTPGSGHSL
ncbi:TPA: transcriptional regulator, partial [Pseudomonas aeruginosa]|nr:transcriptional regulator [Pseudomonas aeruginosa]